MVLRNAVVFAAFLVAGNSTVVAQEGFQNDPLAASPVIKTLSLSRGLVAYGRNNRDAMALIVAAQMRKRLGLNEISRDAVDEGGDGEASDNSAGMDIAAIIADAKRYSRGNKLLLGLVEDLAANTNKGKTDGPAYNIKTIRARGKNNYRNIRFAGGEYAEIYVEGSGRANLDLFVYDSANRLVCSDTDPSDINYCGWTPPKTGAYHVTIVNKGKSANRYSLMTN